MGWRNRIRRAIHRTRTRRLGVAEEGSPGQACGAPRAGPDGGAGWSAPNLPATVSPLARAERPGRGRSRKWRKLWSSWNRLRRPRPSTSSSARATRSFPSKGHVRDLPRNWRPKNFEDASHPPYVLLEDREKAHLGDPRGGGEVRPHHHRDRPRPRGRGHRLAPRGGPQGARHPQSPSCGSCSTRSRSTRSSPPWRMRPRGDSRSTSVGSTRNRRAASSIG